MRKYGNNKIDGQINFIVNRSQRLSKQNQTNFINHTFLPLRVPKVHPSNGDVFDMPIVVQPDQKLFNIQLKDSRKELIKQKIKIRVKEEMLSLLRKNFDRPEQSSESIEDEFAVGSKRLTEFDVYVKGTSFLRFNRRSFMEWKNQKINQQKVVRKRVREGERDLSSSEYLGRTEVKLTKAKPRRIWSSAVKMREGDRLELQKKKARLSVSSVNFQKLEIDKIEPWKHFEDPEITLD